jgi:hypothetical protein
VRGGRRARKSGREGKVLFSLPLSEKFPYNSTLPFGISAVGFGVKG